MKQETLKEVAEKYSQHDAKAYHGFISGAKWQAEQDKNKYSEEDVQNLIKIIEWYDDNSDVRPNWDRIIDGLTMFEWFEQFKKK